MSVGVTEGEGGMMNAVEHVGLDGGVVNHVLKDDVVAYFKRAFKAPIAHVVAAQTTVAAEAVHTGCGFESFFPCIFEGLGSSYCGMVGHFEAVGHVAGEAHVEYGGLNTVVFHDVNNFCLERTCLPSEGGPGFEYELKVGILGLEGYERTYEVLHVVVLSRHEMSAAKVEPFEAGQPSAEFFFDVGQRVFQCVGGTFAVAVAVETYNTFGQSFFLKLTLEHTEARSGSAGIVEFGFDLASFGIDAQSGFGALAGRQLLKTGREMAVLTEGVEGDVTGATHYVAERAVFVSGRIGVGLGAEFFKSEAGFVERGGCGVGNVFAEYAERFPQSKSLESQNKLYAGALGDTAYELQVAAEQRFVHHVAGRGHCVFVCGGLHIIYIMCLVRGM